MENETITITKEHLSELIKSEVETAIKSRGVQRSPNKVKERVVKVRFYNDKLVRTFGNVQDELDEKGKTVWFMDITLDGEKEPVKVEYLKFLDKTPQYRAAVKKIFFEERVELDDPNHEGGQITTVNPDEMNNKNFTSRTVDAEVKKKVKTSEIEIMEGPHQGKVFTVVDNDTVNF